MRAITYDRYGGSSELRLGQVKRKPPLTGEVLVRVRAAGVNPVDWKIREGLMQGVFECAFPVIPGFDMAGDVEALGEGVQGFAPGDKVFAYVRKSLVQDGTYAEYCTVPAHQLALIPDGLNYVEAAALPIAGLTVWQALFSFAGVAPGQYVLVHGGAGGVGSIAVQAARHFGAHVVSTASESNRNFVSSLGAEQVFDYRDPGLWEDLKRAAPRGYDTVLDTVGGVTLENSYGLVKEGGALVTLNDPVSEAICAARGIRGHLVRCVPDPKQLNGIAQAVIDGAIKIPPIEIMDLGQAAQAMDKSQTGHMRGKIVLVVE